MKPIIKYQGGKSREIPLIETLMPKNFSRVVEPFAGGAALSFHLGYPGLLNDLNAPVMNLYRVVQDPSRFPSLLLKVNETKGMEHDELQRIYYECRDLINSEDGSDEERAYALIIIKQLAFSGMERYNSEGKFNVPFGHYKRFSCNLSPEHHRFLQNVVLSNGDAISFIEAATSEDFIFLDPPYLNRLGYETGDGGVKLHQRLVEALKRTKGKWLLVHSDCEFYRDNLSEFDWFVKDFKYSQNFGKGKDHSGSRVAHVYVSNYEKGG